MKQLHEMTLGQRIIITFIIVLAVLLLLALIGWTTGRWDEAQGQGLAVIRCANPIARDRLRATVQEALDVAFEDRVKHLFEIWMRDESDQPRRFLTGARITLSGYINARSIVTEWNPPPCESGAQMESR